MRNIAICALLMMFLSGCVMGIPDSGPAMPKPKVCEKWIVDADRNTAVCVSAAEFERWMRRNMPHRD